MPWRGTDARAARRVAAAIVLVLAIGGVAPGAGAQPSAATGSLNAVISLAGVSGAAPPPGAPPATDQPLGPYAAATVQILDPSAPDSPVDQQVADDSGAVAFILPAGRYWVVVPWTDQVSALPGAPLRAASTPTGQSVLAWAEATVPADSAVDVGLTVRAVLP